MRIKKIIVLPILFLTFFLSVQTTHASTLEDLQLLLVQLRAQLSLLQSQQSALVPSSTCVQLSQGLGLGATDAGSNGQVGKLQQFLRTGGFYTYPTLTGYYGPVTAQAVKTWQIKRGVVSMTGELVYGTVDNATLSAMAHGCENEGDFLFDGEKTGYFQKNNIVYFAPIEGREGVDWFFSKSEKDATKIERADASTFKVIASEPAQTGALFAVDKNHVYFKENILQNADPSTAEVFGKGGAFLLSDKGMYLFDTFIVVGPKSDLEIYGMNETEGASAFHVFVHKKSTNKWYSTATADLIGVRVVTKPTADELGPEIYPENNEMLHN